MKLRFYVLHNRAFARFDGYINYDGQLLTPNEVRFKLGLPPMSDTYKEQLSFRQALQLDWKKTLWLVLLNVLGRLPKEAKEP